MANPNDKQYKELLDSILKGDDEKLNFLLKPKDVYGIRDTTENALGRFVAENYNKPENRLNELFNSKIDMPQIQTSPKIDALAEFHPDANKILLHPSLDEADKLGTILHELGHKSDLSKGYSLDKMTKELGDARGLTGLENAQKYFEGHHMDKPLFGLESLRELLQGNKIKSVSGMSPILKALSLGAAGLGAMGATQKAMADDNIGAALTAGSVIDPTGIVGAANEMRERLRDPEYAKQQTKEDYLNALPPGMSYEQQAINSTEDEDTPLQKLNKKLGN